MRSKFTPIYTFFACLSITFLLISSSGGRSGSFAGAPNDSGTCQNCHLATSGQETGGVSISGLPTDGISANTTYSFTVTLRKPDVLVEENGDIPVGGFQLTATNGMNNTLVGSFNTVVGETGINNVNRLVQITPKEFSNSTTSWNVEWNSGTETLPDNVTFYVAANAANGNGGRDFGSLGSGEDFGYDNSEAVAVNAGLAVDFLHFTTQNANDGIHLNWLVSNENQTAYYAIERSENGKDFTQIATQMANSSSSQYEYTDTNLTKNRTYYYRIQEVATDGKTTLSNIETATYRTLAAEITAYPNPVTSNATVQIKLPTEVAGIVQLVNVQGQVVYTQKVANQSVVNLPTLDLPAGIYQLILQAEGEVYQQKLVIK